MECSAPEPDSPVTTEVPQILNRHFQLDPSGVKHTFTFVLIQEISAFTFYFSLDWSLFLIFH